MNKTLKEQLKPLAPYLGGKFRLAKTIIGKIEQTPHKIYARAFCRYGRHFSAADADPESRSHQ